MTVLKWKRKNDCGQTMSQCGRFWFVTLNAFDAEIDRRKMGEVRLWHADSETLVGHYASASECKAAAQSYLDGLKHRNEEDDPLDRDDGGPTDEDDRTLDLSTLDEIEKRRLASSSGLNSDVAWLIDELVKVCKATDDNPVDEFTVDGARIVRIRTLSQAEVDNEIWPMTTVALELENGIVLYASRDGEGNGPGALFGQYPDGGCFQLGPAAEYVTNRKEQTDE